MPRRIFACPVAWPLRVRSNRAHSQRYRLTHILPHHATSLLQDDFQKNPGDGPGQNTLRRSVDLKDKWKNMHSEKAAAKRQRLEEEAGGKTKQSELSEPKTRQLHLLEQHLPMLTNGQ